MAKLHLDLDLDNAAFDEHPGAEVATILRRFADIVSGYDNLRSITGTFTTLRDSNGNAVGVASMGRRTAKA